MLSNPVNWVFFALMGALALVDLITWLRGSHRDYRSSVVSIGVLGTFVGIYLGLADFDSNDIRASVPTLLEGMKTAFATSIVGMVLAILLGVFCRPVTEESKPETSHEPATQIDLASVLRDEGQQNRQALQAGFTQVDQALQTAIAQLAQGASREIISALAEVIEQFNSRLDQQFGENFQALNKAVGRLVDWQDNHLELVGADRALIGDVQKTLVSFTQGLDQVREWQSQLSESMQSVAPVLARIEQQSAALDQQLSQSQQTAQSTAAALADLDRASASVADALEVQVQALQRLTGDVTRQLPAALGGLEDTLTALTNRFARDYESFLSHYKKLVD